jgi:hypothetical protein
MHLDVLTRLSKEMDCQPNILHLHRTKKFKIK